MTQKALIKALQASDCVSHRWRVSGFCVDRYDFAGACYAGFDGVGVRGEEDGGLMRGGSASVCMAWEE